MTGSLQLPPPFDQFVASPYRFLWHSGLRTAILSDLHLGAEASLARQGIFLPDISTEAVTGAWKEMLALKPAQIIIAGDLFDSPDAGAEAFAFFRLLLDQAGADCSVTLTPGNHDPERRALAAAFPGLQIATSAMIANVTVCHGHDLSQALPENGGRGLIVGHQHPSVMMRSRLQSAKMICFASCQVSRHRLLLLPAFSPLPLGTDLRNPRHWIIDLPRPEMADMRIAGIVAPAKGKPCVLDFGPLDGLG